MPSTPKPPKMPSAQSTAEAQLGYTQKAIQGSQAASMIGQNTPIGSLSYTQTGTDQYGNPMWNANTQLTPEQQAQLQALQSAQLTAGTAGANLFTDVAGQYSQAPDLGTGVNSRVTQAIDRQLPYMERFQAPARDQLRTQLINQGLVEGSPAYQQQFDKLIAQQDLNTGNFINQFQPQAFQQAVQEYQLPAQTATALAQFGAPANLKESLTSTPTFGQQPVDFSGIQKTAYDASYQNYLQKVQAQNNLMGGIFGTAAGVAGLPVTGGGSLGGNFLSGMFGW